MKLDPRYTRRKALVYNRQSTKYQVLNNVGSTAHQRDQRQHAIALGIPGENIEVLDGDLGKSGTTTAQRLDYQHMRARVRSGQVGTIFAASMNRLGRNAHELLGLLEECRDYDVLIVINGEPNDPNNPTQNFTQQILAVIAEYDNVCRTQMMSSARLAKARMGKAVSAPPTGYVPGRDGSWDMDPDPNVQESIRAVFRVFAEERSLPRTARRLKQLEAVIWTRNGVRLIPRKPSVSNVVRILHNPAYKGEYQYPQRKLNRRSGLTPKGYPRTRKANPDEVIVIPDHHVAYVTAAQWDQNLQILAANAPARDRRSPGSGSALLQGVIRCGIHRGLAMATHYGRVRTDGSASHTYQCLGTYFEGGQECGRVTGFHLDRAAGAALLARLAVPKIATIRAEWEEARRYASDEQRRRRIGLQRAQLRVDDAKSRVFNMNPNRRDVVEIYEAELDEAVRGLRELENLLTCEPSEVDRFTEETWHELLNLCGDLGALWNATTTDHRDRKQLLRTMVKAVIVEERVKRGRYLERMTARVVWTDGHEDTVFEVKLRPMAYDLIAQLDTSGHDGGEIAKRLNAEGLVTTQGNPWTKDTVSHAIRSLRAKERIPQRSVSQTVQPTQS